MTMTLEEVSDRMEIQDLLVDYSYAIDRRDWDALDDVFAPGAQIDYSAMGGSRGDLTEIKAFLRTALAGFASSQHMIATAKIILRGDQADGHTICHNPMLFGSQAGRDRGFVCGLWYHDKFVRTANGWRIAERITERCYFSDLGPAQAEG